MRQSVVPCVRVQCWLSRSFQVFAQADVNHDGKLQYEEFVPAMLCVLAEAKAGLRMADTASKASAPTPASRDFLFAGFSPFIEAAGQLSDRTENFHEDLRRTGPGLSWIESNRPDQMAVCDSATGCFPHMNNQPEKGYGEPKRENWRVKSTSIRYGYFEERPPVAQLEWSAGLAAREQHQKHVDVLQRSSEARIAEDSLQCLVCNKKLGSIEYSGSAHGYSWTIHEGYMHYLTEHKVELGEDLLNVAIAIANRKFNRK